MREPEEYLPGQKKRNYTQFIPFLKETAEKENTVDDPAKSVDAHYKKARSLFGWESPELINCVFDKNRPTPPHQEVLVYSYCHGELTDLCVMLHKCTHIFMPSGEFCDWLEASAGDMAGEHVKRALQLLAGFSDDPGGDPDAPTTLVLHFPSDSGRQSFAVSPIAWANDKTPEAERHGLLSIAFSVVPKFGGYGVLSTVASCNVKMERSGRMDKILRLLCGLGQYINCFPETVVRGPPADLKHPSLHRYRAEVTLGISDKIKTSGGTHASPVGHLRIGHFKTLRSERFTKKRFQTIFVHGCFVNGKAATVLSPEETQGETK